MRRCPASNPIISDPKGEGNPPLPLPAGTGSANCWRTGATYSTQEHRAGRLLADRSNLNPPRSPQLMIIDEKNHCKICPNLVFSQNIENPLIFNHFFFFWTKFRNLALMRNLGLEEKKILKSCTSENPYFQKKISIFAPLALLWLPWSSYRNDRQ